MTTNRDAGPSTDQHITGRDEEGDFPTDEEPTGNTPAHGSSNKVINETRGNRQVPEVERR